MPYSGSDPNLIDLQNQINAITTRLNQIDGQGLADPSLCWETAEAKKIAGLQTTVNQVTLKLEQMLITLQASVNALQTLLNQHLGI